LLPELEPRFNEDLGPGLAVVGGVEARLYRHSWGVFGSETQYRKGDKNRRYDFRSQLDRRVSENHIFYGTQLKCGFVQRRG
jgi:hypothetical protein